MIGVPDKFNMVDMGGIDVVESQGIAVDGLFNRLLNAIQNCRYQVLYNWKFAEIPIVPSNVELVFDGEKVTINNYISVTSDDIVHIYSIEQSAVLENLAVTANGIYLPELGVDGFSRVEVNVPASPPNSFVVSTETGDYSTGWYESRRATRVLQSGVLVCALLCFPSQYCCGCYYTLTDYGPAGNVVSGDYIDKRSIVIEGKSIYMYGGLNGAGYQAGATFNFPSQNKASTYSYKGVGVNYLYGPADVANGGAYYQGMSEALKEEFWRLLSFT